MGYSIYRADIEKDKQEILKFWKENHIKTLDKKYEWIYEGNPDGKAKVWILKHDESEKIVGLSVLFPRIYCVNGANFMAGISGDFLVNRQHQMMGPAIMLQKELISAADKGEVDFIYGFPNKKAEPVMKRIGFEFLGESMMLVRTIKTAPYLRRKNLPEFLIRLISPLIDFVLKIIYIETCPRKKYGYICKKTDVSDEGFDQIWQKIKSMYHVIGNRSASYIKWKFLNDPDDINNLYVIYDSKVSSPKGYIVYRFKDNVIDILDFGFTDDQRAAMVLIASFIKEASSLKPESIVITILQNEWVARFFRRFGFMKGQKGKNVYIYCGKNKYSELSQIKESDNWFLLQSDEDT